MKVKVFIPEEALLLVGEVVTENIELAPRH